MSTRFLGPLGKPGQAGVSPRQTETHEVMHSLSLSIVGHAVVQRAPVLLILGVLGGVLVVFGWGFGRKRRLELLAPTAVVASVLATGCMLMLGAMGRGSTPLTVAGMADGQISADSPRVVFDGVADIYSPSAFEGSIVAPLGGWTKPELSTQRGHLLRMRWAELEPMRWDHVHFPSATLKSTVSGTAMATEVISARGTFDMHGFRGQVNGASGQWESVIVGPGGRLAPVFSSKGNFVAGEAQELRPDETTRGNINITPEIRHRIEAMQPWVAAKSHTSDVVMYTWTSALETGVGVEQDGAGAMKSETKLMTLLSAPLEIERPVGRFIIPPAFIKLNSARVAKVGGTAVYDERNYAFMGKIPTGATSTIRFAVPREVLPLKVEKYNLRIDMSAPDREVSVFAIRRGQEGPAAIRKVKAFSRPAGPISVDIPADADLQLDADGTVILGLEVSGPADPTNTTSTWTLNDMLLTVTASTQGEESK
jgi:hypothetical protein